MRLVRRRPNTAIVFMDLAHDEVLLRVAADSDSSPLFWFRLYDVFGAIAAESIGMESFPGGLTIRSQLGEMLLSTPPEINGLIQYRLYNQDGVLVTSSDGTRTQITRLLRMESEAPRLQPYRKEVRP